MAYSAEQLEIIKNSEFNPYHEIKRDGILRRISNKESVGMSIRDYETLKTQFEIIISSSIDFPVQPALINFGLLNGNLENLRCFYSYYNSIKSCNDRDKIHFAALALTNEFEFVTQNRMNNLANLKVFAYHFRLSLDLRKINHNYSMIYQIIADMNYRAFANNFLASYFVTKPTKGKNPEIVLEIIVSNASLFTNKLLSCKTGEYYDSIFDNTFGAVNRVYTSGMRNSNENNIPIYSVFKDNNIIRPETAYAPNPGYSYRDLYETVYGAEMYNILPDQETNMKPCYYPDTEKINKKKREQRAAAKNTESGYLNS